jgi:predicted nucleotidyltransferase
MVPEQALAQSARQAGLRLLVLFGSRVLGQVHGQSDWDFGYLAGGTLDEELLRERLMEILGTDLVDLVDLSKASALLRIQVAVGGKPVFEDETGIFQTFQIDAASFWCDVEPVLRAAYRQILDGLQAA